MSRESIIDIEHDVTRYSFFFSVDEEFDLGHAALLARTRRKSRFISYRGDHNIAKALGSKERLRAFLGFALARDLPGLSSLGLVEVSASDISTIQAFHSWVKQPELAQDYGDIESLDVRLVPTKALDIYDNMLRQSVFPASIVPGTEVDFSSSDRYLAGGWGKPEGFGVWSVGKRHRISMSLVDWQSCKSIRISLDVKGFVTEAHPQQRFQIEVNGVSLTAGVLTVRNKRDEIAFILPPVKVLHIDISTPDAVSPRSLGLKADRRELGIAISSLKVERLYS